MFVTCFRGIEVAKLVLRFLMARFLRFTCSTCRLSVHFCNSHFRCFGDVAAKAKESHSVRQTQPAIYIQAIRRCRWHRAAGKHNTKEKVVVVAV